MFFFSLLKTNMFWSETDGTKGPRLPFMFLRQPDGLMFRLLHLSQTPKAGGPGALRFHPTVCFSAQLQAHRYGDGSNERGKNAGVHCVLCRCLKGTGSSLVFRMLFLFNASWSKGKWMAFLALFWLVWSLVWSVCVWVRCLALIHGCFACRGNEITFLHYCGWMFVV